MRDGLPFPGRAHSVGESKEERMNRPRRTASWGQHGALGAAPTPRDEGPVDGDDDDEDTGPKQRVPATGPDGDGDPLVDDPLGDDDPFGDDDAPTAIRPKVPPRELGPERRPST